MDKITIDISPGELADRISILSIKSRRIGDDDKRKRAVEQLAALTPKSPVCVDPTNSHTMLKEQLECVNEILWDVENAIRSCEKHEDFGSLFTTLARMVYTMNDHRADLKRQIDELFHSKIGEPKSYTTY